MRQFLITVTILMNYSQISEGVKSSVSWHVHAIDPKEAYEKAHSGMAAFWTSLAGNPQHGKDYTVCVEEVLHRSWLKRILGIGR